MKTETMVGVVSAINRYPVKSLGGESITSTPVGWHGLGADRRYAFVKTANQTGFPWLTLRDCPQLVQYHSRLADPKDVRSSGVLVQKPDGNTVLVNDAGLLQEVQQLAKCELHLLQHFGGVFDCADIAMITTQTIAGLERSLGLQLDVRRFRPNLVIQGSDPSDFPEEKWVGGLLVFGSRSDSARIRVNRKDPRCRVTGVDPVTGAKSPEIPLGIVKARKNLAGVYGTTQFPGTINVGDSVFLHL